MQIRDILAQIGGLRSMANELGVGESDAAAGADALLPAILGGFKKQAQSRPAGLEGLGGLLGQLGGGGLLDDVLGPQPTNVNRGNDVLGEIFGSRDVSRAVAQDAADYGDAPETYAQAVHTDPGAEWLGPQGEPAVSGESEPCPVARWRLRHAELPRFPRRRWLGLSGHRRRGAGAGFEESPGRVAHGARAQPVEAVRGAVR